MRRLDSSTDRIDWFRVLIDLQRRGLPVSLVAGQLRIPESTILRWKQGAEPRYADGEALVSLWARLMDAPRDTAPRLGCANGQDCAPASAANSLP